MQEGFSLSTFLRTSIRNDSGYYASCYHRRCRRENVRHVKQQKITNYNREYPSNMVSPLPGGILDSGGSIPWAEPNKETSALTLKSSIGVRVMAARHEGHVYWGPGNREVCVYALAHSRGNSSGRRRAALSCGGRGVYPGWLLRNRA